MLVTSFPGNYADPSEANDLKSHPLGPQWTRALNEMCLLPPVPFILHGRDGHLPLLQGSWETRESEGRESNPTLRLWV